MRTGGVASQSSPLCQGAGEENKNDVGNMRGPVEDGLGVWADGRLRRAAVFSTGPFEERVETGGSSDLV